MLQLALTIIIFLIIVIPVGRYMYHIATWNHTLADPVFDRLDGVIYKIGGVNPHQGMNWRQYALALVGTNAVMVAIGYLILRIQSVGIFNPNSIGNMEPTLAFNTIISFMTNTNLQHYSGESGLSYLSQMLVIIFMMFVSAASGYAACIAFIRGLTGKTKDDVGNFFADLTRITTRLLLPFSIVGGLLLGLSRACVAEFTFYLAIPVMAGASLLKVVKFALSGAAITGSEVAVLVTGCVVAFVVSLAAIRFLMDYVKRHNFKFFGLYRIVLGVIVLAVAAVSAIA